MMYYVCAPYAADDDHTVYEHISFAREVARALNEAGFLTLVPHTMFPGAVETQWTRDKVMHLCLTIVPHMYALVVCGDRISKGMQQEISKMWYGGRIIYTIGDDVDDIVRQVRQEGEQ